jgi:hypothetical protein
MLPRQRFMQITKSTCLVRQHAHTLPAYAIRYYTQPYNWPIAAYIGRFAKQLKLSTNVIEAIAVVFSVYVIGTCPWLGKHP